MDCEIQKPLERTAKEAREEFIRTQAVLILRNLLVSLRSETVISPVNDLNQ